MPLRKSSSNNNYKEIKNIINKNIASSLRTQSSFGELLRFNGCSALKVGSVGYDIRKQLLKEAKNGNLTVEAVIPRSYELIGEFLGISNVKTFKDMDIEYASPKIEDNKPKYCGNCGSLIAEDSKFCSNCGHELFYGPLKCSKCGEINEFDSNFCVNCGNKLNEIGEPTREEFQEYIDDFKNELEDKNLVNISIGDNNKLNKNIKNDFYQTLDDEVIKKYDSNEEKTEMKSRHEQKELKKQKLLKFDEKYDKAKKLMRELEYEKAIELFLELLNDDACDKYISPLIYSDLSDCYYYIDDYDKAIEVLEKGIQNTNNTEMHSFLKSNIESIQSIKTKDKITDIRREAMNLYRIGEYDEAIPLFNQCIELGDKENHTYAIFADIYHRKREFELEIQILEKGIENTNFEPLIHNELHTGLGDKLENIEFYLENGKFKWDCLPVDNNTIPPKIKKAKSVLKENEERGVELLEDILEEGTFNNTVYYTLYKTYLKNGKFNSAVSIADEAIENLGFYSQDRLEKWIKYKEKAIFKKEKEK